jgi:predicted RNA methylase
LTAPKQRPARDLDAALADPGYTPSARDVGALVAIAATGDARAKAAEKALAKAAGPALAAAVSALSTSTDAPARRRTVRLVGALSRLGRAAEGDAALAAALDDADAPTRSAAAGALGRLGDRAFEAALVAALAREADAAVRRALIDAAGKIGGATTRAALDAAAPDASADDASARVVRRARLKLDRDAARAAPTIVDLGAPLRTPTRVLVRCRGGLEPMLLEELAPLHPSIDEHGVEVSLRGALKELYRARTMLDFAFPLADERVVGSGDGAVAAAVARALTSDAALALLRRLTLATGPGGAADVRVRVELAGAGKRRGLLWQIAEALAARAKGVVNDPRESPWIARVRVDGSVARVELTPSIDDPRFTYRSRDVPAASHPTIAAALARLGGVRRGEVVWDPFCGSGLELCERALLGPFDRLVGSDHDPRALEAARANLEGCGASPFELVESDATRLTPEPAPTLIVTNPPLGRRVERSTDLAPRLEAFIAHASRALAPGGRVAWISPFPARTAERAEAAHLTVARTLDVDLGGFTCAMQLLVKPQERAPRR